MSDENPLGAPYEAGKLEWQVIDRDTACREILEHAVDLLESKGNLAVALTLARNAGQYFADRAKHIVGKSTRPVLTKIHANVLAEEGWPGADSFNVLMFQDADRLKHFSPGQPSTVRISSALAAVQLLIAVTDCKQVTGNAGPKLEAWLSRELPRAQGFRFKVSPPPSMLTTLHETARQQGAAWAASFKRATNTGGRVEVLLPRGEGGVWYAGTQLMDGRVQLDEHLPFAPEEQLVLEPEEIAEIRAAP